MCVDQRVRSDNVVEELSRVAESVELFYGPLAVFTPLDKPCKQREQFSGPRNFLQRGRPLL